MIGIGASWNADAPASLSGRRRQRQTWRIPSFTADFGNSDPAHGGRSMTYFDVLFWLSIGMGIAAQRLIG
jgi:hypothetical protein